MELKLIKNVNEIMQQLMSHVLMPQIFLMLATEASLNATQKRDAYCQVGDVTEKRTAMMEVMSYIAVRSGA